MKLASFVAALGATLTASLLAQAQPPDGTPTSTTVTAEAPAERKAVPPAPRNALELTAGAGYTQGVGSLMSGVGMPSVATIGYGLDAGIGYRIDPRWAVLLTGQYQELNAQRTDAARGFNTSIVAQYHFAPTRRLDPWVEAGAGWRFLWEAPEVGPTVLTHGIQLARVRVGLDIRGDAHAAFGPMIGADANLFLYQDVLSGQQATTIGDPRVSTFLYAGVQGRFDIGNKTSSSSRTMARR
jgi:hypothetical protein